MFKIDPAIESALPLDQSNYQTLVNPSIDALTSLVSHDDAMKMTEKIISEENCIISAIKSEYEILLNDKVKQSRINVAKTIIVYFLKKIVKFKKILKLENCKFIIY